MKRSFLTLTLLTFCAFGALAQGISGGLKVGANFANQKFDGDGGDFSPDARTSFHFGGYLNLGVSEAFSVQPELLYNSLGAKSGDIALKANYLSIPVMLKYNPVPVFNVHAGPQVGMLLSAKVDDGDESEDVKESYKGLDLGVGFGAGVDLPMGLGISARYILGLSNISEEVDDVEGAKVTNTNFQISVSYKLFGK